MNYSIIISTLGKVIGLEAILLLIPFFTGLIYKEKQALAFLITSIICFIISYLAKKKKVKDKIYFTKEGLVIVAFSWIFMSILGALPFVITGEIPNFIDALFETVSGFTTTGASILTEVESLSHASLMWRSFTHWIGGMGVVVFMLAILPSSTGGYDIHLMRAESPGPSVGKLVPRIRDTAKYLYIIYLVLTLAQIVVLLLCKMPLFDAIATSVGTAGTGGFGIKNDSMASYSPLIQNVVTIFMILFGINFNFYFILFLSKHKKDIFKLEEVFVYILVILSAIALITYDIRLIYGNIFDSLRHAAFQVATVITTTGFATTDFNMWSSFSKTILVLLMFVGACAGSTGGGIKVSRILILIKSSIRDISKYVHPNGVKAIRLDRRVVPDEVVAGVASFFGVYILIFIATLFVISFERFDVATTFTAVVATFNNIGPGLEMVGPSGNFAAFSGISKLTLIFAMLAGRLELYPMLILFAHGIWRKNKVKK